ncbi:MAG: plasmid pRiA4b ORF-3 family protein [Flavobacteriaceae bacterium]|nr:plasmid pRiA4b ORF-3 family protein [Flavobacteriaceae bacterium]
MIYKIRLILDTKEDVIRDIAVSNETTLEDLHNSITNAFGFDGNEMASFYLTDDNWNQGEEIPLFNMGDANEAIAMQNFFIKDVLSEDKSKLIYVYDFFSMWTFFVELITVAEDTNQFDLPSLLLSVGAVPSEAPEKKFTSENIGDDPAENYDNLENFDDFDFDNFDEMIN